MILSSWGLVALCRASSSCMRPSWTRWARCWSKVCMPRAPPSWRACLISSMRSGSLMHSRTVGVPSMISRPRTRPPPTLGRRRWLTMPTMLSERPWRIWSRSWGAKKSMMRLTLRMASWVCRVLKTRWPVWAALRAASTVSLSRISPMRMTSGSWRMLARRPLAKLMVSRPSSRWLIMAMRSLWRTSMGSSRVTMLTGWVALMWSRRLARVVVLPLPVGPVTRIRPRSCCASCSKVSTGRPSCWKVGMGLSSMTRMIRPMLPRCQ